MLVKKEHQPNKKEWIDDHFEEANYSTYFREEDGVYEIYHGNKLVGKADSHEEAEEFIRFHKGV